MYFRFLLILCLLIHFKVSAQEPLTKQQHLDKLKTNTRDSVLLDTYLELIWPIYSYDVPDSSLLYGEKAIQLANELNDTKRLSIAHRRIGITYSNIGDIKKSIDHQQLSYELAEKINFRRGMQLALNNIGVAYLNNEILTQALSYFLKSLKLAEEENNAAGIEQIYYNCALIYRSLENNSESKSYLLRAIKIADQKKDSNMLLVCYSGLSMNCRNIRETDSSIYYLSIAKHFLNSNRSSSSKFGYYVNEGLLLSGQGEHQKALDVFLNSQKFATIHSDVITALINIAEEYQKLKNKDKALTYFNLAYDLSFKSKTYDNLSFISSSIAKIYHSEGQYKKFAEYIQLHLNFKDSSDKYSKVQQIQKQQLEFEFNRKIIADSLHFIHAEKLKNVELEIAEAKLNKEKVFNIMLSLLTVSVVVFLVFIFYRLKITRAQKLTIEKQKQLVELKNHEILDSIIYAKRLQSAILPQLEEIRKEWNMDLLYLPKDIIGGDFYFFEKKSNYTFFAICDCTGHGIPGAIMSVVCHNALHKAIHEFNLFEPGLILDKTRQIVIDSLNAEHQKINDGMDCTLIVYNHNNESLEWAGAFNNLWLIHENQLTELKADKQPIGFYENKKSFETHTVPILPNTTLYMLSDGYGDQFGGPIGKKYKNKNLKNFLLTIHEKDASTQIDLLKNNIVEWQGELDQVDDITIAVIKFS